MDPPPGDLPDPLAVTPLAHPPNVEIDVPGGRSLTNRALVTAALAPGTSRLLGPGRSDDVEAMVEGLRALGATIEPAGDPASSDLIVTGVGGRPRGPAELFTRLSGTTSRFLTPVAALADRPVRIDAAGPMRARPMADLLDALRALGARVVEEGEPGHLPVTVTGPLVGREVEVPGDASSQFLSGLLLAGGARPEGLRVRRTGERLVSAPYIAMTRSVMAAFGVTVTEGPDRELIVPGGGYRSCDYPIEPDAATAAYFLAAALLTGGRVRVPRLASADLQADAAVVGVFEAMGATVTGDGGGIEVRGPEPGSGGRVRLRGGTFDLTDFSDMAPTVAVLGAFAGEPVRVTGVGFIRGKESDRIAAPVAELRRCGVDAVETDDGFVVWPEGPAGDGPHGATIETYDDHRMAMSFALLGLVVPGIAVSDPGCVAKTHPGYWADLDRLRT